MHKKQKYPTMPVSLEVGQLPPQNIELEKDILGAFMALPEILHEHAHELKPEAFYKEAHRHIFYGIKQVVENNQAVNVLTVTQALKAAGLLQEIGGPIYLTQLTANLPSSIYIESQTYIYHLKQTYMARELIRKCHETSQAAYANTIEPQQLLAKHFTDLNQSADILYKKAATELPDIVEERLLRITKGMEEKKEIPGVLSGSANLDQKTGGWQKSDLIIIAARPGMGKTAFVLGNALFSAECNFKVAIFSLEMSSGQLIDRFLSLKTEIPLERIRKSKLTPPEKERIDTEGAKIAKLPMYIDDTAGITPFELKNKCLKYKNTGGLDLVIVDYLQLMSNGRPDDQTVKIVGDCSQALKNLAKELDVPVIALSQLSRAVESRGGEKRPLLSDLRDSGNIEQDADLVGFIYRPAYYGILEDENGNPADTLAEFILAKHRNGSLDTVPMHFEGKYTRFSDNPPNQFTPTIHPNPTAHIEPNNNFENDTEKPF